MANDSRLDELPLGLRAVLEAELAAGNSIAEIFNGFPAPPIGGCVMLSDTFRAPEALRAGLDWRFRKSSSCSGELTDAGRRWFLLTPPNPADAVEPDMNAIREELERAVAEADRARWKANADGWTMEDAVWREAGQIRSLPVIGRLGEYYKIKVDHRGEMITYYEPERSATIVCTWWDGPVRIERRTLNGWWYAEAKKSVPMTAEEADLVYANILEALGRRGEGPRRPGH
ncbi:MAG: hypothetical protein ABI823_17745, partial [Bryobacteraceae bacterium]